MPHVTAGESFEGDDDTRDQARVGANCVLPAALRGRRGNRRAGETYGALVLKLEGIEGPAVEYLEPDQVQVDGVRVFRQIDQFPDLSRVQHRLLSHRHVPGSVIQQHTHRLLNHIHALVQSETTRLYRAAFWNLCIRA